MAGVVKAAKLGQGMAVTVIEAEAVVRMVREVVEVVLEPFW